ncbi:KIDINS220, partial [Symbiodinium natans]
CLRLRGAARAMDVCKIIHDQNWLLKTQSLFHSHMEEELKQVQQQLLALSGKVGTMNSMNSMSLRPSNVAQRGSVGSAWSTTKREPDPGFNVQDGSLEESLMMRLRCSSEGFKLP